MNAPTRWEDHPRLRDISASLPRALRATGSPRRRSLSSFAPGATVLSTRAERLGITVIEVTRLKPTPALMAIAISRKSCPACSSMKIIGTKTAIVVNVLARMAPQTSTVPSYAARKSGFPSCRWR